MHFSVIWPWFTKVSSQKSNDIGLYKRFIFQNFVKSWFLEVPIILKLKKMKRILLRISFFALLMLTISATSNALVTFKFKVNVNADNCYPYNYHGLYSVQCDIYSSGGSLLCTGYGTGLALGTDKLISFNCDIPDQEAGCNYTVVITVCRQTTPPTCCTQNYFTNIVCWSWLTEGTHVFNVSL